MNKEELLQFAAGTDGEIKGLIYNYEINEADEVVILFAAVLGDGTGHNVNSCVRFNGVKENERVPSQTEINKALKKFIDDNGRQNFHVGMCYDPHKFMRINNKIDTL